MPLVTAPADIEQSDFSFGFAPDGQDMQEPGALRDASDLLLDTASGAMETRLGFTDKVRLINTEGYRIVAMHRFQAGANRRIIVVITNDTDANDNVQVFEVDPLDGFAKTRIDDTGVNWSHPSSYHWGIMVDNVYYGGSIGNEMYSWNGTTWDPTAATGNYKTAVHDVGVSVDEANEYGQDYAYKGTEKVAYHGDVFTPNRSNRFDPWDSNDSDDSYRKGDKVTHTVSGWGYPTSYVCIKAHDPSDSATIPGAGGSWKTYWRKIQLPLPTDSDGNTNTKSWDFIIIAPQTSVAKWFADRLWLRADGQGDKSRLAFSAPIKPVKGEDIADTEWDPKDFTPANDNRGEGGGWMEFNDGKHHGSIRALTTYDQYLLVFKNAAVWALSGNSSQSFSPRKLNRGGGTLCETSVTHHKGLVYYLNDSGLHVTDGTTCEPVGGTEKIREYLRARIDDNQADDSKYLCELFSWNDFVWVCIPTSGLGSTDDGNYVTLAYHPESQSWWKTTLPIQTIHKVNIDGVDGLYFGHQGNYGSANKPYLCQYIGSTDADLDGSDTTSAIEWFFTAAWWPFGLERMQRRIRRVWALVKGEATYSISEARDYDPSNYVATTTVVSVSTPKYIEGCWVPDCHSLQIGMTGSQAPVAIHGVGVETEPRRKRYHTG